MIIGLTTGCFDLFHQGHRHVLTEAAKQCDWLIIAVNSDKWCQSNKGVGRPFRTLEQRIADIRDFGFSLSGARGGSQLAKFTVIPFNGNDGDLARVIQPSVIFRGFDQSMNFSTFPVIRICGIPGFSTTLAAQQRSSGG